jgi:hypothetical protein
VSFINRQPTGWLGFLGIKNFGRNPTQAAETLAPTWELSDLYLATGRRLITTVGTYTGTGTYPVQGVPPGQVWYVYAASVISSLLVAGNTLNATMQIYNTSLGQAVTLGGTGPQLGVPVGGRCVAALNRPIILVPGEALASYCATFSGANIGYTANVLYTVLEA